MANKRNKIKKYSRFKFKKLKLANFKKTLVNIKSEIVELPAEPLQGTSKSATSAQYPETSDGTLVEQQSLLPRVFDIPQKVLDTERVTGTVSPQILPISDMKLENLQPVSVTPPPSVAEAPEDPLYIGEHECQTNPIKEITGRGYILKQLQQQKHDHLFHCDENCLDLVTEKRIGLVTHFNFKCRMCKKHFQVCVY